VETGDAAPVPEDARLAVPEDEAVERSSAPCPWDSDPRYMALQATLQEQRKERDRLTFQEASDLIFDSMEADRPKPTGRPLVEALCCALGCLLLAAVLLLILLLFTRATFTDMAARDGLLRAAGGTYRPGEEPIVAVGSVREARSLAGAAALPVQLLRNVRDVALVHEGVWRCLHITSVAKYSDWHLWLEAADGSGIRVRGSKVSFRQGFLGDEEVLASSEDFFLEQGNTSNASNASLLEIDTAGVVPTAHFDVVLQPA